MTPRALLADLVTDPDDDCVLVLKSRSGFQAWVPKTMKEAVRSGDMPLHLLRTLVAQHYLSRTPREFPEMVTLSARAVSHLLDHAGPSKTEIPRKTATLKSSFTRMMKKLQVGPATDAILVFNRDDHNRVYIPDAATESLDAGTAETHLVIATALFEILRDGVRYYQPYWRNALEDILPGYVAASGLDAAMARAGEISQQGG